MAKIAARNAGILVHGTDLSGRHNSATLTFSSEVPEVTSFTNVARERVAGGLRDVTLALNGFWDNAASQVDAKYSDLLGASGYLAFGPQGFGASKSTIRAFPGILEEYEIVDEVAAAVTISSRFSGSALLVRGTSFGTIDNTGGSGATDSVDFGASSACVHAFVHVLTYDGATSVGASLQHSGDDTTFTTLIDFGSLTAAGSAVAASATSASRYRRLKHEVSPSGGTASARLVCICSNM